MIRDVWYPVLEARKLKRKPVRLDRFGRRFVAWRAEDGRVRVADAYCPHRGVSLDQGKVVNGRIVCPMHGFQFDGSGACQLMPCEGQGAKIPPGLRLDLQVADEAHGLIWMWHGEPRAEYPEIVLFPYADLPLERSAEVSYVVNYNYTRLMETHLDMHHLAFAHHKGVPWIGPKMHEYSAELDGLSIKTRGVLAAEDGSKGTPFICDAQLPCASFVTAADSFRLIIITAPIDDKRTWMFIRYYQDIVKLPVLRRVMAWMLLQYEYRILQPQDWPLFDEMHGGTTGGTVDDVPMVLVKSDAGLALYRKRRRQLLAAQAESDAQKDELRVLPHQPDDAPARAAEGRAASR